MRPRTTPHGGVAGYLATPGVAVRLLTLTLAGGGLIGSVTNFLLANDVWPWDMPGLAYRFLAAAAAAYVVGAVICLTRQDWPSHEFLLVTVLVYGVPLTGAVLVDRDVIDWDRWSAWLFVVVVSAALAITIASLWRNRRNGGPGRAGVGPVVRLWFVLLGVVTSALGLLVFFAPREAGGVWPWADLAAWKTLDSRLVASMLLTVGVGGLHVALRNSWAMATVFVPMLVGYCTVAVAGLIIHAADTPALRRDDWTYVGVLAAVTIVTTVLLLMERGKTRCRS